ncbi:hypothetical protein BLA60_13450 [Actinophytocola xinjiangensis]|uniref:Uncharacterized protein n=2 Tax=Actinophytocola xinjiangensis TaxID=485602 RepID=A0A7Z1AYT8_9PSEU|nr:hypothetical protein BLA60_13450 [Actinophytocola xinjiangensis]
MGEKSRKIRKALTDTVRDLIAGIGLAGSLLGTVAVLAEGLHRTALGIACLAMGFAGFVCALLSFRGNARRNWLLALSSATLTGAIFVVQSLT